MNMFSPPLFLFVHNLILHNKHFNNLSENQVVPTQYKTLYGDLSYINQYSVIEKACPLEQMQHTEPIDGLHLRDFQGVVFTYDFHPVSKSAFSVSLVNIYLICSRFFCHTGMNKSQPQLWNFFLMYLCIYCITKQVMLYMEERRERIIDFVSNLFGIVGGVITVLR